MAIEPAPTKISDLFGSGERILIRRAIDMYIAHYRAQAVLHKGDDYELPHDLANVQAAIDLSNRILTNS